MDIMVYIILALVAVIAGMYFWRQFTASQLDTAKNELAGLKALGTHQSKNSGEVNSANEKLKKELDEKFKDTIAGLNADIVPNTLGPGYLSRPIEQLSQHELRARLQRAEAALKTIMDWKDRVRG